MVIFLLVSTHINIDTCILKRRSQCCILFYLKSDVRDVRRFSEVQKDCRIYDVLCMLFTMGMGVFLA